MGAQPADRRPHPAEGADFRNFTYAKYGHVVQQQPGMFAWQVFDAKVDDLLRDEYRIRQVTKVTANSLEELAAKLDGVNADGFLKTVREYNAAVRQDVPFNPVSLALGAEATFVGRTLDMDRTHTIQLLQAAYDHPGSALIEIYQNCNVFNDKAFIELTGKQERFANRIDLVHGEPIVFGAEKEKAVIWDNGRAAIVDRSSVDASQIIVHDAHAEDSSAAYAISRLAHGPHGPTPLGIFRDVVRPVYDEVVEAQVEAAKAKKGNGEIGALLSSLGTWTVD